MTALNIYVWMGEPPINWILFNIARIFNDFQEAKFNEESEHVVTNSILQITASD